MGFHLDASAVLITAGTAEANFLSIAQRVDRGEEIVVDVPGWPQPLVLGEAIGARVRRLQRREENAWRFDPDDLKALVNDRTRLIFICNPNNPTGSVLSREELEAVVEIARSVGAYLLCDEVYAGLEWSVPPTARVVNLYEKGISTGSVSKVLGLQGLRIGWLASADEDLVFDAMVLREDTSEIMNVLGEMIAEIALGEEFYSRALKKARDQGRQNLQILDRFIRERCELEWHPPEAGLIGLCRLNLAIDGKTLDGDSLFERLLAPPYRTFVIPGSAYGYPHHLRLGVGGGNSQELEDGLRQLERFFDSPGTAPASSPP